MTFKSLPRLLCLPALLLASPWARGAVVKKVTTWYEVLEVPTMVSQAQAAPTPAAPAPAATVSAASAPAPLTGPTFFLANLMPVAGLPNVTASGTASFDYDPATNLAIISVTFSNLTSPEVSCHLVIGDPAQGGQFLTGFGVGQVIDHEWYPQPTTQFSLADIITALQTGNLFVDIATADNPGGELRGRLIQTTGSQVFVPPPDVPAPSISSLVYLSSTDAARFLTQATFGPTAADINLVTGIGIPQWIANQKALPPTSHLAATRADAAAFPNTPPSDSTIQYYKLTQQNRQAAWWLTAVRAPDQLRQRVAFALSEIFVISDVNSTLSDQPEALARYYDLLVNDAFGNFRQLLEDVTLSPAMGIYLSTLQNQKGNPTKGTSADENYAREVQQLFTIGLNQLHPDGTLVLDVNGAPVPTYDQATITETAKVFTGWAFATNSFFAYPPNTLATGDPDTSAWLNPMQFYSRFHDTGTKTIVGGVVIPANQTGAQDLKLMLDTLFNHPNTGPFICRQLIQHLVTSNPSPGYVYRVAQVFADNHNGVRGDLGAVVSAILTDYEARTTSLTNNIGYGKLKEPLIRATGLFRAMNSRSFNGRYAIFNPEAWGEQAALRSPTVFNFFSPSYVLPGATAAAGLVSPEFGITDANSTITLPNALRGYVFASGTGLVPDLSSLTPLTNKALVNQLSLLFCNNAMSTAVKNQILTALGLLPKTTSAAERVQTALQLTLVSSDCAIQK